MKPRCPNCNSALVWTDHKGTRATACTECGWVLPPQTSDVTPLEFPYILQKFNLPLIEQLSLKADHEDVRNICALILESRSAEAERMGNELAILRRCRKLALARAEAYADLSISESKPFSDHDRLEMDEMVQAWMGIADELTTIFNKAKLHHGNI